MNVVELKGCRRCGGDLFKERDNYGVTVSCLQCGATYAKRLEVVPPVKYKTKIVAR